MKTGARRLGLVPNSKAMRIAAFLAAGLLLLIAQGNLYPFIGWLNIHGATPNLVLPLVLFVGVHEGRMLRGALIAFGLGYATDIVASAPVGLFSLVSVACWWLARVAGVRLTAQTLWTRVGLCFGFSLVETLLVLILLAIFGVDPQRPVELASIAFPHAISTGLFSLVIFPLAERVHYATARARSAAFEAP